MTPDGVPILSRGSHDDPSFGACLMEYVSLLAGEPFSASPDCTHVALAELARTVNDETPDYDRHTLIPYLSLLPNTNPKGEAGLELSVAMIMRVATLVAPKMTKVGRACIEQARLGRLFAWGAWPPPSKADQVGVHAADALLQRHHARYTARAAVVAGAEALVMPKRELLDELLDVHQQLFNPPAVPLTPEVLTRLRQAVTPTGRHANDDPAVSRPA